METVKVSSKGHILIPKAIRESKQIKAGTEYILSITGEELHLTPVPKIAETTLEEAAGILANPKREALSEEETSLRIKSMLKAQDEATKSD
jgi:AbrB family looped-hinge helix DNA binding protein